MKGLMNYVDDHAADGAFIGLMSAKGYDKFYESFGFKAREADAPGMFKVIKETPNTYKTSECQGAKGSL